MSITARNLCATVRKNLAAAVLLVSILSLTGCSQSETSRPGVADATADGPPPAVVAGTVTSIDGTVPKKARVSIQMGGRFGETVHSVSVGTDGNFQVALDTSGVSRLTFAGLYRDEASPAIYLARGDTARMEARLAPPATDADSAEMSVRGTFNGFEARSGMIPMKSQDNAIYTATVPATGDSLAYQIVSETESRRVFLSGTGADRYEYRGRRSGHQSVVAAPGDSVTVTFDYARLPNGRGETEVTFADSTSLAARYHRFASFLKAQRDAYNRARRDDGKPADTIDWSVSHGKIRSVLKRDLDIQRRDAYLATYLKYTPDPNPALAQRAINQIAADGPAWGLGGFLVLPYRAAAATGDLDSHRPFFYDVLQSHPSPELKAGLLLQMLSNAKQEEADDRQRLLYAWMAGEYSDSRYADIARSRFNPDKLVQAGTPAPSFEVGALRSEQTFTPVDFKGQYVLIDFWATWCTPCIEEFPNLRKAYRRYDRNELAILSVSLDREQKTVSNFLKDRDLPWQHGFAEEAFDSPIAKQFQVTGIPKPVLVGPEGTIVAALDRLRGKALMETLRRKVGASSES